MAKVGRPERTGTYRLQLRPAFTFDDATALLDYLDALGVSHAYLSPVLQAVPGSTHGYDVVDHAQISVDLGGEDGLRRLAAGLRARGMGAVADLVPNHMAVPAPESLNRPLWSVLRDGPASDYAGWFDVNWQAQDFAILMPVLGRPIGECLDAGEIVPGTAGRDAAGADGREEPVLRYYNHVFPVLPGTERLPLPELLDAQWYRLAYWRIADEEVNYRRFFDIDSLVAIRVEDDTVFAATHELPVRLVAEGVLDGLRIDHPDGLADPRGYLRKLAAATGGAWVVVEKVLQADEELPGDWPCAGTTGYEAARVLTGLFVDPGGEPALTGAHQRLTGTTAAFSQVAAEAKRKVLDDLLHADVRRLVEALSEICQQDVRLHDHTERGLTEALTELIVALPVYRTYCMPGETPPAESVAVLERAAQAARGRLPAGRHATLDLVRDLALGRHGVDGVFGEFMIRFQQTTAPATAKGVEDTALYRWSRLLALNEVGGDPARFGVSPQRFHAFCARVARDWPATLTALSTHDTKRAEDVRARLAVLSELPGEWERAVGTLAAAAGAPRPDAEVEYLLWQTLVGAWPIDTERLATYLTKATREAKLYTSWLAPDEGYEAAVQALGRRALTEPALRNTVGAFVARIAPYARVNSLGQKLLQLAMPGIPDIYQGCELTDFSLVDPDNRRPVDYARRRALLARLDAGEPARNLDEEKLLVTSRALRLRRERPEWFGAGADYRPVPARGPAADHLVGFGRAGHVVAVATRLAVSLERRGGWAETALDLPGGRWTDRLTGRVHEGGPVAAAALLDVLPVALLVRGDGTAES